jgi:hypothetical protein
VRSARRIIKYFLCAGLRIKGEKESCKQDSPPAAGRDSDTLPPSAAVRLLLFSYTEKSRGKSTPAFLYSFI